MEMIDITASDFCNSVRDGTHDSPKPVEGHGRPLVTTKHMKGGRVSIEDAYLISEADFEKVNQRSQVHQWDVMISMIGTLGELVLVKDEPTYAIKNIGLFKTKSKYDGLWLYYYLQSPKAKNHMNTSAQGSTQQYLSLQTLRGFPLSVPESETDKRAICEILKTIDDKIELNQKMNQTLEEIAKAIFKSWFVDFDPVRAKSEGRPTGLPSEISDLFPDELVESEIGEVPKGWFVSTLGDICDLVTKGTTPTSVGGKFTENGNIKFVKVESVTEDGQLLPSKFARIDAETDALLKRSSLNEGDVLLSIAGTIGRCTIMPKRFLPANTNQALAILRCRGTEDFVLQTLRTNRIQMNFKSKIVQAVQANLSLGEIKNTKCVLPKDEELVQLIGPIKLIRQANDIRNQETSILEELRDTLLPKLISGELRIPDAERFLREAGV